jgi:hypothetical protein
VIVLLVIGAFQLSVNSSLRPPTAAEQASSQAQYEEARRFWEENERTCDNAGSPPDCRYPEPQLSEFSFSRPFAEVTAESLELSIYLVALAALMSPAASSAPSTAAAPSATGSASFPARPGVLSKLLTVVAFSALASACSPGLALLAALVVPAGTGSRWADWARAGHARTRGSGGGGPRGARVLHRPIGRHTAAAIGRCSATCSSGSSATRS